MEKGKRPVFCYKVGKTNVCREVFCLAVGLSPSNSRIRKFERMMRGGHKALPPPARNPKKGFYAKCEQLSQFFLDYIVKHAEKSPSLPLLILDRPSLKVLWERYQKEFTQEEQVTRKSFLTLWYQCLQRDVPDPEKGCFYRVKLRRRRSVGFKTCDECARLKLLIQLAETHHERVKAKLNAEKHWTSVRRDREFLAHIRYMCRMGATCVGFALDAADQAKFRIPTTKSTAKVTTTV